MRLTRWIAALAFGAAAVPAFAGPPFLTDDPIPTDPGHWEIYGFAAGDGRNSTVDAEAGFDFNYGPIENVQLTATLPFSFSHQAFQGWRSGTGDLEVGLKYRFIHDEKNGLSAAIFPRAIVPTASHSPGEQTRFLLPLWLGMDFADGTTLFGGGGYTINPGAGNRDFWQAAVAVSHDLSKTVSVGVEATRQGAETVGSTAQTSGGLGTIFQLSSHYALLLSGGPTWVDHQVSYHFYGALGLSF